MSPATIQNNYKPMSRPSERVSFQKYKRREFFTDEPVEMREESTNY